MSVCCPSCTTSVLLCFCEKVAHLLLFFCCTHHQNHTVISLQICCSVSNDAGNRDGEPLPIDEICDHDKPVACVKQTDAYNTIACVWKARGFDAFLRHT